jgi:hypothetical protein
MKKVSSFRLSDGSLKTLNKYREPLMMSKTAIIEMLLEVFAKNADQVIHMYYNKKSLNSEKN